MNETVHLPDPPTSGWDCPYCHSHFLVYEDSDFRGSNFYQIVSCEDCGKSWEEVYSYQYRRELSDY